MHPPRGESAAFGSSGGGGHGLWLDGQQAPVLPTAGVHLPGAAQTGPGAAQRHHVPRHAMGERLGAVAVSLRPLDSALDVYSEPSL